MKLQKVHFKQKINLALNIIRSITIQSPNKSSVLIYDNENSEVIKKYVLADLSYSILYTRWEKIFLSPNIIFRMVERIFTGSLFGGSFVSKLYRAYLISYIEYVDPKVVITIIDNDILYYVISNYFPNIKFYAIQNGTRFPEHVCAHKKALLPFGNPNDDNSYNVIIICFGYKEKAYYINSNFCVKDILPLGSLKASIYEDILSKKTGNKESYDICLVSQYTGTKEDIETLLELNKINSFIKKLIDETGYKLCISFRSNEKGELDYFKDCFEDSIYFINCHTEIFSTYHAMHSSKLIIAYSSTCVFEAISLDKKVLFCGPNNHKYNLFGDVEIPSLFVSTENYSSFKDAVINLIDMDSDTYVNELQMYKRYLMNSDEDVPLYIYLRDSILKSINN